MISQDEIYRIYREYYTDNMGSVSAEDVGYLQKIINEIRPSDVLEIGTASGMSTGFIARFMAEHAAGPSEALTLARITMLTGRSPWVTWQIGFMSAMKYR